MTTKKILFIIVLAVLAQTSVAQQSAAPKVIKTTKLYKKYIKTNPSAKLIPIVKVIPTIEFFMAYATDSNFTRKTLYDKWAEPYLNKEAADSLIKVQNWLAKMGLGLKIWDGYRPFAATNQMWQLIQDERYVANPAKGSGHNRGIAVDVTLINLTTGKELDMGTKFDNFTDTAHIDFKHLSAEILRNREILKTAMESFGFKALSTEWWHFYIPNRSHLPLLNISFKRLKMLVN